MKKDDYDVYGPAGPAIEPSLLLRYLIEKSEDLSTRNFTGFPLPFRGLGLSVLDPFSDLKEDFLIIISPSEEPVNERAKKCREIFVEALGRPQPLDSNFYVSKGDEDHRFEKVVSNRFAWEARRLGEEMVEEKDFRFISIWTCMTWIGLYGDAEKLRDFQEKCLEISDPEERIEQVIPILWAAITRKVKEN